MSFFNELKRRNVFRVGIAYAVATWLLLQVTDIVFPRIGLPDSAVTLVIALLGIGFIPAIIFAWAFEMTPDGIRREKDVDRSHSITPTTGRKLDRVIIAALALTVIWFLVDEYYLEPQQADVASATTPPAANVSDVDHEAAKSIAVLPFINMSADADNEYFSDGISEELLNVLVKVSTLHVASRTSTFAYKGKNLPISQIAKELKVDNILEGSVRKAGNRVRITAQLINAKSDRHIWSETYERELDDIFDIQEEISNNIVAALKIALNVDEADAIDRGVRPTENTEAYEFYLQGRFAWRQRGEEKLRNSIQLFEKAIALDPDFARAHEGLASAWMVMPSWSDMRNAETVANAKPHAIRALELDPTLPEARAALAEILFDEHRWADGVAEYQKAIKNEPRNPTLHQWLGEAFAGMGFLTKSLAELHIAYQLDPAAPVINSSIVWIATMAGEDDLALKHVGIADSLGLTQRAALQSIDVRVRRGEWDVLFASMDAVEGFTDLERRCLHTIREPALIPQLIPELDQYLEEQHESTDSPGIIQCVSLVGQPDRAARLATTRMDDRWNSVWVFWRRNPMSGAMRQTTTFRQKLNDFGLLDYYREYGWPDLCQPVGEDDFKCDS